MLTASLAINRQASFIRYNNRSVFEVPAFIRNYMVGKHTGSLNLDETTAPIPSRFVQLFLFHGLKFVHGRSGRYGSKLVICKRIIHELHFVMYLVGFNFECK